jgi:TetR/AcrR family fatty acid metabolism transcriptional regulator
MSACMFGNARGGFYLMTEQLEKKKALIMKAATTVFARMGYYNSRVSDIAREANMAYGLFYHYFPSKDDVLISIFQNAWKNFIQGIEKIDETVDNPVEKIKRIVTFSLDNYERNPDLLKVIIMDVPRLDKFYDEDNQRLYQKFFTGVSQIIAKGQSSGVFNKKVNPEVISYIILGSIDAVVRQYVYNPNLKKNSPGISKTVDQVIEVLVEGIL